MSSWQRCPGVCHTRRDGCTVLAPGVISMPGEGKVGQTASSYRNTHLFHFLSKHGVHWLFVVEIWRWIMFVQLYCLSYQLVDLSSILGLSDGWVPVQSGSDIKGRIWLIFFCIFIFFNISPAYQSTNISRRMVLPILKRSTHALNGYSQIKIRSGFFQTCSACGF